MNFWQFIIEVIHYAAWPAAAIATLIVLRKPISSLLERPIRLRRGELLMELNVPRKLQEKIYEDKALFEATKDTLDFNNYLDTVEAFTLSCGFLALELQGQPEQTELRQLAEDTFLAGVKKIITERPNTDSILLFSKIESVLKSSQKVRWTYRPLPEVIREKRDEK